MHPIDACFLENPIPPEGPDYCISSRYSQVDEDGVLWFPDLAPPGHLVADESILLDQRGTTRHLSWASTDHPAKTVQKEFWREQTAYKNSIAAKLREVHMDEEAATLESCHSYYTVATCNDCGRVAKFPNRCDLFYCPECNHSLTQHRTAQVSWWVATIKQPKHICLTVKNIHDLTTEHITELRSWFTKLRHRKFARGWKGGFYSIQITKSATGWHPHIHALVEAQWIDHAALNENWSSVTKGAGQVTCVRDCRDKGYLRRITSYVARGSELAAWQPSEIKACINAFEGHRTFGVFGALYGMRTEFAEWIAELKQKRPRCECGSCNVQYQRESDIIMSDLIPDRATKPRPPPMTQEQKDLVLGGPAWPD